MPSFAKVMLGCGLQGIGASPYHRAAIVSHLLVVVGCTESNRDAPRVHDHNNRGMRLKWHNGEMLVQVVLFALLFQVGSDQR